MLRESSVAIDALLHPASIAIVGASTTSYVGRVLCENLRDLGYEGEVYPINPRYERILDWRCFASLDELPEAPEAVVSAVRIDLAPDVLRAAGKRGTRAAVIPGGGFTETGESVWATYREIADVAAVFGMAVCGPNCMGVIAPGRRSSMYIGTIPASLLPGRVALLSQSGSVVEAAVNLGPRIGFSALVSCGTEVVTNVGQYLEHFARDPGTLAVALFLEGFVDPTGFVRGARALREAGKPLAVLKAGRSAEAAEAVAAHSGSLAGADDVVTGLLHQLGAIGVDDLDELFEVAELLGHARLPRGRRLFVVTDSGGEANLVADLARSAGLELPAPSESLKERLRTRWPNFSYIGNPIDPWGVDPDYEVLYAEILAAAAEEHVDVVAVAMDKVTPWAGENEVHLGVAAADALIASTMNTGLLPVFLTIPSTGPAAESVRQRLRHAGVPLLHGLRPAMVAIRRAWYWQWWRPRTPIEPADPPIPLMFAEPGPILSERASREVLAAYGIPLAPGEVADSADEAASAADRLGFPVVMKADLPGVAHKLAAGFVVTGVSSADATRRAFETLQAKVAEAGETPGGVLVEATATGLELICGMRRDPLFGPVVLIGLGGTFTELLHEVAVRVCPVSPEDLLEMPDECAVGRFLDIAGIGREPLRETVAAISRLALEHPEIEELDVNPLFAGPGGVLAADALVVLRRHDAKGDDR